MKNNNERKGRKILERLEYHVVDSTSLLAASTPIYGAMEVTLAKMPDDVSLSSRLTVAALTYGGIGSLFAKGRDLSRRLFSITDKTRETIQTLHDSLYAATFNGITTPPPFT